MTSDHYTELVEIYSKYKNSGLEIFGFPCGQFMGQELAKESDIREFISKNFKVDFPMFSKIEVNGANAHPIYKYLKYNCQEMNNNNGLKNVPWNFGKFLVNNSGQVLRFYGPKIKPKYMIDDIEKYLQTKGNLIDE